jgi:hypothetical protein
VIASAHIRSASKPAAGAEVVAYRPDTIETMMRLRIRNTIERLVDEELETALGATKSARVGAERQGYRHGTRGRTLTASLGPTMFPATAAATSRLSCHASGEDRRQ